MGTCNFGCQKNKDGNYLPIIEVEIKNKKYTFITLDAEFKELSSAREFIMGVYLSLTGPQNNLRYDKAGSIKPLV